jgi:hypothetical protein
VAHLTRLVAVYPKGPHQRGPLTLRYIYVKLVVKKEGRLPRVAVWGWPLLERSARGRQAFQALLFCLPIGIRLERVHFLSRVHVFPPVSPAMADYIPSIAAVQWSNGGNRGRREPPCAHTHQVPPLKTNIWAHFCATQLTQDRHAGDMPAKSPTFSVLLGLSAHTPLV